jgi:hypothetical protein
MKTGLTPYARQTDRLKAAWLDANGRLVVQGKRVAADCPLTPAERVAYVRQGPVQAVKLVKARLNCDLATAWQLVKDARSY